MLSLFNDDIKKKNKKKKPFTRQISDIQNGSFI